MYTYERFYNHYVIKQDGKILYHIDTEAEAKKEIFLLSSENIDTTKEQIISNSKNYTVYHLHSWYSLIDSCTSPKEYIEKAKELGQKAICFTEHGNIYNWFEKKKLCEENGIKYLHGIECYVTETLEEKIRDNWHTILIAKNYDGFVEINNLFYKSYSEDHTYYKHRISLDEFLNISDNVIKISACIQSPLWQMRKSIMNNEENQDRKDKYIKLLKHYDYYEIQYHDFEDQIEFNRFLYKMSKAYNKPLIVGTDTHNISDYKGECRIMLQYGKTDGAWGDSENECDLTYKTYSELIDKFEKQNSLPMEVILDAIENTNRMADSCDVLEIDTHNKYPYLYGDKDEEVMWKVLKDNYKQKLADGIITDDKAYIDNIKEEMAVFKKTNMIGFMLFMSELMTWAKDNNIATGSARGSVAGSTVAYMSNITDVDPIIWKTIFSRFCNEHRVEIGDIDTDWYEDDRQKIYDYIIDRFGTEKTGYVLAMGTLADKSVIDVLGKALKIKAEEKGETSIYTLDKMKEIKKQYDKDPEGTREEYSDLFYYYDGLVGCVISQSQHPAGIIASPINLVDFCGAFLGKDGQQILPLDMDCCHDAGLVKYDILGLKSVGVIDKTCKLVNRHYPKVHEIDFNDQKVYEDMTNDHTAIFQFESDFAGDCLKRMKCHSVFDMSLVNACIRPSGESYRDKLLDKIPNKNPSEIIDKLLENNYGWLVYQEDTIAFLQQICGFSGSDADNVRRAIGRKKVDELNKALPKILDGYCSKSDKPRDVAEEEAKAFLKVIEDASSYQFGYNHSVAYSIMSYLCGYFRYYYPTEFCTSFLNCAKNDDDIFNGTDLAIKRGCTIRNPKFRYSKSEFGCDPENKIIYKGIGSIKDIGKNCGDLLYELKDNHYDSFLDLLKAIKDDSRADKTELDILTKIDFFAEFGAINDLILLTDLYNKYYKSKVLAKEKLSSAELEIARRHCGKESDKQLRDIDNIALIYDLFNLYEKKPTTEYTKLHYELKYLGYSSIVISDADKSYYGIGSIETNKYGTVFLNLYHISDGYTRQIKVNRKWWQEYGANIEVGDIIECIFETKNKRRLIDNKWTELDEQEETLKVFAKIDM